jgi:hypothetical protein
MKEKLEFKLVGYDCPIGRYPSPATPIVDNPRYNDDNDRYMAVYLDDDWQVDTEPVPANSKFIKLSPAQNKKLGLGKFDCHKQRLFAVSENDIRPYQVQREKLFFGGLLSDENFSREDPFFRISLAEEIKDQNLIEEELVAGEQYIDENKPELKWLLDEERLRLNKQLTANNRVLQSIGGKPSSKNIDSICKALKLRSPSGINEEFYPKTA